MSDFNTSTVREVEPGIFVTELYNKTAENGVQQIHIYIIPGKAGVNHGRSLMIDTGFRTTDCLVTLEQALKDLHISVTDLDIFLTHRHHDHSGLASILTKEGARVYMNRQEERHPYDCIAYKLTVESREAQKHVLHSVGVDPDHTPEIWSTFMRLSERVEEEGESVLATLGFPYTDVKAGDLFCYGDYALKAVSLKGHTYGQMGLIDEAHRLFFPADQLIEGISPIVATTYPDEALLDGFFQSLAWIKHHCRESEGWKLYPAHGNMITRICEDVDLTVYSYLNKSSIIKEILKKADHPMTVREVAEAAYHIQKLPDDDGAFFQYKMMVTKTFSLLEYLMGLDFVTRSDVNGTFYWKIK